MAEQDQKQSATPEDEVQDSVQDDAAEAPPVAEQAAAEDSAAAGDEVAAGDGEDPSPEDVVAQLQADVEAARDAALRAQADAQNVKRRAEQDVEKARKFALERFAGDLLPVVDNLERALEAASDDEAVRPIVEGVELTLKSFLDAIGKYNIEQLNPEGEPFDPQLHQAMSMVDNPDVEPNTVIAVVQKGYTLNGRLVRPAMVMVSKSGG